MNPVRPCPQCGKDTDFHESEIERVEDGRAICLQCGLELEEANMVLDMVAGKHPELVEEILARDEEGGDDESSDDE